MKLKELGKVDKMGTTLSDRSNFFLNHPNDDFINSLKQTLQKDIDETKMYQELLMKLETMWVCKVEDYFDTDLKQFECIIDFDQFTVYLVARPDKLISEVLDYFKEMLNLKPAC